MNVLQCLVASYARLNYIVRHDLRDSDGFRYKRLEYRHGKAVPAFLGVPVYQCVNCVFAG